MYRQTTESESWTTISKTNGKVTSTVPHTFTYLVSSANGTSTPNFHKRLRAGELLPHTGWHQRFAEHNYVPAHYYTLRLSDGRVDEAINAWHGYNSEGHPKWALSAIQGNANTAYAMSEVQRAAASIYGSGYDALTGLVEARKIGKLFGKTARRFRDIIARTRKLRRDEILDAWAEGRYGYRTLAYDLRDLNESINDFNENRRIWTERSGYSDRDRSVSTEIINWSSRSIQVVITDETEHSIRGSVAALIKPARFGVNPLVTAWELIPYSFVVDWAISVGDALGSAMLLATAEDVTSSIGVKSTTKRTVEENITFKPGYQGSGQLSYQATRTEITRVPTSISVKPTLRGRIIRPDQVLDLTSFVKMERRRIT